MYWGLSEDKRATVPTDRPVFRMAVQQQDPPVPTGISEEPSSGDEPVVPTAPVVTEKKSTAVPLPKWNDTDPIPQRSSNSQKTGTDTIQFDPPTAPISLDPQQTSVPDMTDAKKQLSAMIDLLIKKNNEHDKQLGAHFGSEDGSVFLFNGDRNGEQMEFIAVTLSGYRNIIVDPRNSDLSTLIAAKNMNEAMQEGAGTGFKRNEETHTEDLFIEWGNEIFNFSSETNTLKEFDNLESVTTNVSQKIDHLEDLKKQKEEAARKQKIEDTLRVTNDLLTKYGKI